MSFGQFARLIFIIRKEIYCLGQKDKKGDTEKPMHTAFAISVFCDIKMSNKFEGGIPVCPIIFRIQGLICTIKLPI